MHPGHAAGRLAPLVALIICPALAGSAMAQVVPLRYDAYPKRDGSLQYIEYTLPAHWTQRNASAIGVAMYVAQGHATYEAEFASSALTPYDRSRVVYESHPELNGPVSFFLLLYYRPLQEFRVSAVNEIHFDRPLRGPVARPSIYARTQPVIPQPNRDPNGDVYVDPARGDDRNNGSMQAPVRNIDRGLALVQARFPTPESRAGRHLILRDGTYEGSANPADSVIDLFHWQGGMPGNNFTIRGYPGETVRLRGHAGQRGFYHFALELEGTKFVTLENLIIDNASSQEGINLDLTEGVSLRFVEVYAFGSKWGAQAFGELTDLLVEGCRFSGASGEHDFYVAAGTTTPGRLGRRIIFRGNQFDHANWWGLQINGTVQDVLIENNLFWENGLGPITVKGGSGITIRNNTMVGNNREISIENYFDSDYWHRGYGPDPLGMGRGDVIDWWRTHFSTMGYIDILYNTIVVPDVACMPPQGTGPGERPAITLAEYARTDVTGYPIAEPFTHVRIDNNIVVSSSPAILRYEVSNPLDSSRAERMIEAFEVHDNLFFATQGPVAFAQTTSQVFQPLAAMELGYSGWHDNIFDRDPIFWYLAPCAGYRTGQFYDWENITYPGDLRVNPWSPAVDRGRLATYSNGARHLLFSDRIGRPRLLTPDLGARESFDW